MDQDEAAIMEAAALTALEIPFDYVFVFDKEGFPIQVKIVTK